MTTVRPTIGVFAGIFNHKGEILVKRREQDESLPGGAVEAEICEKASSEIIIRHELAREIFEETGLEISNKIQIMPAMYPVVLPSKDWAFGIIIGVVDDDPSIGEYEFISPQKLEELAVRPIGNRLVSGSGKRMHRLTLRMFASRDCPNQEFRELAAKRLHEIQQEMK